MKKWIKTSSKRFSLRLSSVLLANRSDKNIHPLVVLQYMGKTNLQLRTRINKHRSCIYRGEPNPPVSRHFQEAQHSATALKFCGIDKVDCSRRDTDLETKPLQRESKWIFPLKTEAPRSQWNPKPVLFSVDIQSDLHVPAWSQILWHFLCHYCFTWLTCVFTTVVYVFYIYDHENCWCGILHATYW